MKLHLEGRRGINRITAYGDGYIMVNEERFNGAIAVSPGQLFTKWAPRGTTTQVLDALAPQHLERLTELTPNIFLLGTGRQQRFPDSRVSVWLAGLGIGLEVMDTGAACRTYNILVSEGREVLAALLPMEDSNEES